MAKGGSVLTGLIVGSFGVVAGLLLAPKAGKEARKILRDVRGKGGKYINKSGNYVGGLRDKFRQRASEGIADTLEAIRKPSDSTQPVDAVSDIGAIRRGQLESGGIVTVGDLANAQASEVAGLLETTEEQAMKFINAAREMTTQ